MQAFDRVVPRSAMNRTVSVVSDACMYAIKQRNGRIRESEATRARKGKINNVGVKTKTGLALCRCRLVLLARDNINSADSPTNRDLLTLPSTQPRLLSESGRILTLSSMAGPQRGTSSVPKSRGTPCLRCWVANRFITRNPLRLHRLLSAMSYRFEDPRPAQVVDHNPADIRRHFIEVVVFFIQNRRRS
jgi:hypothetical protein